MKLDATLLGTLGGRTRLGDQPYCQHQLAVSNINEHNTIPRCERKYVNWRKQSSNSTFHQRTIQTRTDKTFCRQTNRSQGLFQ